MSDLKNSLSNEDMAALLDTACHGRPFLPKQVWQWLDADDIESLRHGDMTIFEIMAGLDSVQASGRKLDDSGHQLTFPAITKEDHKKELASSNNENPSDLSPQ